MLRIALPCRLSLAPAAIGACGSSDDSRPPRFEGDLSEVSAVACRTLVSDGFALRGSTLLVEDEPASCAGHGMVCPLNQTEDLEADCEPGEQAHAFCEQATWRLRCMMVPDSLAGGAGTAGVGAGGGAAGVLALTAGTGRSG